MREQTERALFWWTMIASLVLFWGVIFYALYPVVAGANPFLVCDPNANTEWYEIENLDFVSGQSIQAQPDGSIYLDLAPMTVDGTYNIQARACNAWGCSSNVPFSFTKAPPPSDPINPRLVP